MEMPGKEDNFVRLRAGITLIEEEEDDAILQVESAQAKLDALMLCRDYENNYRYDKFRDTHILRKWLSHNPPKCSNG